MNMGKRKGHWGWFGSIVGVAGAAALAGGVSAGSSGAPPSGGAATGHATSAAPKTPREIVAAGGVLLDVRTPGEFAGRHLEGALNIPLGELSARLGELPPGADVVVYCRSGNRSSMARPVLERAGHRVIDIGTMSRW